MGKQITTRQFEKICDLIAQIQKVCSDADTSSINMWLTQAHVVDQKEVYVCQMKNDLSAYVHVLGVKEVSRKFPPVETRPITGCLVRLEDALKHKKDLHSQRLLDVIRRREHINGQKPYGDPELIKITEECAQVCLDYYNSLDDSLVS